RIESRNGARPTGLTALICRYFDIAKFQQLIPDVYSSVEPAERLAGLSQFVATSDLNGQPFWLNILLRAGVRLAKLCMPLLVGLDSANWSGVVHVSGSVLANCEPVRESFEAELTAKAKRSLSVESPALSAAKGAALMALKKMAPPKVDEAAARLAKRES
ncbi:MAG: hypothetical protein MKZ85_02765, partial [Pedosphaera sp.]|nr:hypothetical protein [Pedosphaera sp.]